MVKLTGGEGNDKITGTELADTIDGRFGNDILNGLGGDDIISGSDGLDTINGGLGNDRIDGGLGDNKLDGGDGDDTIFGGNGNDEITGGAGDDVIKGLAGFDIVWGGQGSDTITDVDGKIFGENGDDILGSGGGFNSVEGGGANVEIYGGSGNDIIQISFAPIMDGGEGDDLISMAYYSRTNIKPQAINGGLGYDILDFSLMTQFWEPGMTGLNWNNISGFEKINFSRLIPSGWIEPIEVNNQIIYLSEPGIVLPDTVGQAGTVLFLVDARIPLDCSAETDSNLDITGVSVIGGQLADTISGRGVIDGQAGDDTINGGLGNDTITGGGGDDSIDGGDGLDTAVFSGARANYTVTEITYNTFTVAANVGSDGTDTIVDVNKLQFSDQTVDVVIRGFEIVGDDGADALTGGRFADRIDGAGGDDKLAGAGGNDLIEGGTGKDTISGGTGNDLLNGDDGNDQLIGGVGNDLLDGGTGNDTLTSGDGNDTVNAGDGDDLIVGGDGAGNDKYDGGDGADTVKYTSALSGILVDLAAAKNQARSIAPLDAAGIGVDQLRGIENIIGGNFADRLSGNAADNILEGGTGSDLLTGRAGNDILDGGDGGDKMLGGAGNDTYLLDSARDQVFETVTAARTDARDAGGIDSITSSVSFNLGASNGTNFVENLTLSGTANLSGRGNGLANAITGNAGSNSLFGNGGDDRLSGGAGADRLAGGAGSDTLLGGLGKDSFVLDFAANAATNLDTIVDFSRVQGDKILLSPSAYAGLGGVGKLTADKFYTAAGATQALDASDRIIYDNTSGTVYYDADGVGGSSSVAIAVLGTSAHPALAFDDFLIVA